jgi:outer membrane protease
MFTACGQTKIKGQYRKIYSNGKFNQQTRELLFNTDTKKIKVSDAEWKRFYPKIMKYPVTQIPKDLYRKILGHR